MTPLQHLQSDTLMCNWDPAPFLLFSNEVEPLVYYSHLFPATAVAVLAIVVLMRSSSRLTSKLFFSISILFSTFAIFDLILWATEQPALIMFLWSMLTYIEPLIYAAMLYFVYVFAWEKDSSLSSKLLVGILLLPIIVLGPTSLNLVGFDYTNCWRLAVEGPLLFYVYAVEIVLVTIMIITAKLAIRATSDTAKKKTLRFLLFGALMFLLAFSSGNIFGTLLQGVLGEEAWVIGQYGLFGMPVFLGFIMYLMANNRIFAARVVAAEVIILSMMIALTSLLFIPNRETMLPVLLLTILLFAALGYMLIRGIRNDIHQREEIEQLAKKLATANKRLRKIDQAKSEFVSIASHQLRSPLTAVRGYASLLADGSFGKLPKKATEAAERIHESSATMASSIEDFLNVSRIESGKLKYDEVDFNLKTETEHIVDDKRREAVKKGLVLKFSSKLTDKQGIVNGDLGKTKQILHNLITNALKYTETGSINVSVKDLEKENMIAVTIDDTGIGLSEDDMDIIFKKFERAESGRTVNSTGTGLGLFIAKQMAQKMGGDVTAQSEGERKGSTFTFTLPAQM